MFASRFTIVFTFAAVASLVAAPAPAQTRQTFPAKPVRFVPARSAAQATCSRARSRPN